jgi:uncharacterized cupredoxin-like copper-binding protein
MPRTFARSLAVVLVLTAASCSGSHSGSDPIGDVGITLKDFSLTADPASFASGDVTFAISNEGPSAHEFVIIRSGDEPEQLPVENGLVPEDQVDLVDEAEDIAPGTSTTLTVNLEPGTYVLVCNLPAHYEQGMHAAFTVR